MRLFFVGCSHTYGDDLDSPATQSWPAVLSKEYAADFVNAAISGGTNERNVYHVIKNVNGFDKFYIAWTYTQRFTRYRSENNFEINFNPSMTNALYGKDPSYLEYGKLHYAYWHNELYSFKIWLQQIILLQRFLESQKKSYVMINSCPNNIDKWTVSWQDFNNSVKSLLCFDRMDDDQLYQEHNEIQTLISQIDLNRFIGWGQWSISSLGHAYPVGKTKHLLDEGHRAVANYILENDPDTRPDS